MAQTSTRKFPLYAKDYELYEEVGDGVSATVYRALCIPLNEVVAVKVLDLENCVNDLDRIQREVQTVTLIDHPNLLRAHCSFTNGHNLWVVMPYMAGGSCLQIMKSSYPEGFDEPVIATLLREVLKALEYLHTHGHIHRDVKAGNILLDSNGAVKLADFGVSACMYDTGDRQRSRKTISGTPCWMAPEVVQPESGYNFKADIWSFGITALELAHGHAPFSKYPPSKVFLMTLQNAPPGLDYERDKRFSKSFKEMVGACLVKDPKKRPTSEKLLKHSFFKHARSIEYLERNILSNMSPLGERFSKLKAKEADMLVQNNALYEDKDQLSKKEYIRGISEWNFNLEDLKNQAAMIQDDLMSNSEDSSVRGKHSDGQEKLDPERAHHSRTASPPVDELNDMHLEDSLDVFPMKPLQALKGCFDVCEDDVAAGSPSSRDSAHSDPEQQSQQQAFSSVDQEARKDDFKDCSQSGPLLHSAIAGPRKFSSGSLQDYVLSPKKLIGNGGRDYLQPRYQSERNYSGPLQYHQRKDLSNSPGGDDTSEGAVFERRGRFKVTSAELSPKGLVSNPVSGGSTSPATPNHCAASVLPSLHFLLQQTTAQRDEILKLIKFVEQSSGNVAESIEGGKNGVLQINPSAKECELEAHVNQIQQSIGSLVEELQIMKAKNSQLERKLNELLEKDSNGSAERGQGNEDGMIYGTSFRV